ncbi:MAG TPA: carboxypeptidase-like regulatory domain-containing protein, partial [Candidatus Sulfotelmatobacter sp.]|nr:carboxypeptidase-like regulatory domain-containing protein [Candidatus Sulfotelmatobacter sp.]
LLRLSERDFRSQSAVMVLKAGAVLSGVVLDDQRNPVPGAKVTQNRDWGNVEANQFTRADGSFRFGNLGEGPWVVTAQADGFMGTDQTVPVGKQAEPCRFVLERAGRLQGRVEDDLGNPIANASLYATESSDRERFESVICTDAAGRFEWRSAPLTPCRYNIDAYGFKSRRAELLVPDGTERIVVLERAPIPRPARISGTVLDAETHQPIRSFEVWSAVTYRQQFASGSSQSVGMASELKTTGTNGTFAFLLLARGRSVESCDVEIKANGYLPGRETIRGSGTNGAHVTLALKPKVNLAGSVKLPNGEPVAGTVVLLCAEETSDLAYMRRPGQFDLKLSRGPHAATDARGQFTLPRPRSGGTLFVAHSLGYAELRLSHSDTAPTLILKPWGRVTGTLKLGNRLATNAAVSLDTLFYNGQRPALQVHLVSNTDQEGHFVIEGVPPGEWKVSPHGSYLQLRAGETARLALGGGGCTVVGRFTAPDRSPATNSQGLVVALETQLPDLAQPNRSQFASEAEYAAAKDNWLRRKSLFLLSDPGRQALRERREYVTQLDQNGAFKFEGALPGNYELRFRTDPLRQDLALIETYDAATRQVVVPEPENPDVATLDLGELLLPTSQRTVHQDFALPGR